jgi:hypothetical protein
MQLLQDTEDYLLTDEKVVMISHFMNNAVTADTYLSLTNKDVRQGWIRMMLDTAI